MTREVHPFWKMMMRRNLSILILGVLLTGCTSSQPARDFQIGTQSLTMAHDGLTRSYGLHLPASYTGRRKVPLVVALHCYGIDGAIFMQRTGWVGMSDEHGFLLLFPEATGDPPEWNEGVGLNPATREVDDEGFVVALIRMIMAEYTVDSRRMYVTGHSSGAFLAHLLAARHADLITAIGSVAGQGTQSQIDALDPARPVAVVHFHALDDESVPFAGGPAAGVPCPPVMAALGAWARVNGCAARPDTLVHSGGLLGLEWRARSRHGEVRLYRLDTGGHSWPTAPCSATELLWVFFSEQIGR